MDEVGRSKLDVLPEALAGPLAAVLIAPAFYLSMAFLAVITLATGVIMQKRSHDKFKGYVTSHKRAITRVVVLSQLLATIPGAGLECGRRVRPSATDPVRDMRIGAVVVTVWLIIGVLAAGQRYCFSGSDASCAKAGTMAVTIIAGSLNYVGVNPKVKCGVPQPSK